mmetsp:Transcript_33763/g.86499  ORF Transcript_33763/g.86499 Transcript_33763/m.86499 type:complete len:1181 (-) Transcript_33763:39-3581(-)
MGGGDGGGDCVKVAIRCRPPSTKEINNNESCIVEMNEAFAGSDGDAGQVVLNDPSGNEEPATFAFDIVFGLAVQQQTVYESVGKTAMMKTFEGYNGTIFAYGQTGSGKSWSMSGARSPPELVGIIPRMNEALFEHIAEQQVGTRKFLVMCSYFEIYNEVIFDLLNPVADRGKLGGGLQVKEHPVMGIYVKDLTEIVAEEASKLEDMLEAGIKNRAVSSTMMNSTSSRSHSIFTVKVHQKDEEDASRNVFAKLNLVDLAGSERQKGTGATGQTLKEGANINKSLSALGNVINALVECANGKKVFIPYRNSKLTRVLQESLGGNSLCTMLATLSPAACNYEETMSTLRYANRAKAIKVSATKNEEASQISRLKAEVEELKKKLAAGGGGVTGAGGLTESEREAEKEKFEKQLKEMEQMMNSNWSEKTKLSEQHKRQIQKLAEERRRAAQAVEEQRSKRLLMLQEKNDIELSVRGFIDFVMHMPKISNPTGVLTGEHPRQWLKTLRSLRQQIDELKEQRTLALVFKHAFDEDVKLWGEGAEAEDMSIAATGLNRCLLKLDKLRMGGKKLFQLESQCLGDASMLAESVKVGIAEVQALASSMATEGTQEQEGEGEKAESAESKEGAALEEVVRILYIVQKQLHEKVDEVERLASMELGPTGQIVLQSTRNCLAAGELVPEESMKYCDNLEVIITDPCLASLPASLPRKPLRQYDPSEVQDTPDTTEALLGQLIRWERLCGDKTKKSASELLARPPPKFILDVTVALKASTGFPPDLPTDWPEDRNERLARFQHIADAVKGDLGVVPDFEPSDVLKGKEVPKTLRLVQLLALAGARRMPTPQPGVAGSVRAQHISAVLNAVDRCLQGAKEQVDARRDASAAEADGAEKSLEEKIAELERQLQEETRLRRKQEQALADMERQLQESLAEVKKVSNECELTKASEGQDPELNELEHQVSELLSKAATPAEMRDDDVLDMLRSQLDSLKQELANDETNFSSLQEKQEELESALAKLSASARKAEAELQRERQRAETEKELMGQSPEEQIMILKAHEQKLRTRAATLEEQVTQIEKEAEERKAHNLEIERERKELEATAADTHLQMQIVQEERDAMREAMENLWHEKARVDEDLQDKTEGYNNLTERLNSQQDETCELESMVEMLRQEVDALKGGRNGHLHGHNGTAAA